jgi:peptidyl-prolyl cis-trans isomerase D
MLIQMHKHMKWIMWTIVVLITIAFLFFGIYPSSGNGNTVARVDGYTISADELNRVYMNMTENYRQLFKDQFNQQFADALKKQALQELIRNRLLVQEAEKKGLKVPDEELQAYIMQIPAFTNQGRFDQRAYEAALRNINMSPAKFEANQREYLMRRKLERLVEDSVVVLDSELQAAYAEKNPKAKKGDFEKNMENFRKTSLSEKRRESLDAYVKNLMNKAEVKINQTAAS